MTLDDASPTEDARRRAARSTAVVALVACAAVLVASIAAGALVHLVQRGTGSSSAPIQARAWFQDAGSVSVGISNIVPIPFVIVPTSDLPVHWVAYDNGRINQRGIARGKAGSNVVVTLSPFTLTPGTWLVVGISGVQTSLKAWVK